MEKSIFECKLMIKLNLCGLALWPATALKHGLPRFTEGVFYSRFGCTEWSLDNGPSLARTATRHRPGCFNYSPRERGNSEPLPKMTEQTQKQSKERVKLQNWQTYCSKATRQKQFSSAISQKAVKQKVSLTKLSIET